MFKYLVLTLVQLLEFFLGMGEVSADGDLLLGGRL